jgi:hypothetical protein
MRGQDGGSSVQLFPASHLVTTEGMSLLSLSMDTSDFQGGLLVRNTSAEEKQLRPQPVFYNRLSLLFAGHQAVYAIDGVFCQRLYRLMFCTSRII